MVKKAPAKKAPAKKAPAKKAPAKKAPAKKAPAKKAPAKKAPAKKAPAKKAPAKKAPAKKAPAKPQVDPALTQRIASLWERLESLAKAAGRSLTLGDGASEATIAAAEKRMGLTFPPGFRASLTLHDGMAAFSAGDEPTMPWMPGCCPLAPIADLLDHWKDLQGLADEYPAPDGVEDGGRVKAGPYRKKLIPIAGTRYWDGDNTYLDLDPGPNGTAGQLITMTTECDFTFLGSSFEEALERWVVALERGEWVYDAKRGAEYPKGEKPFDGHAAARFSPV